MARHPTRQVAFERLDLDDLGTELRQQLAGEGAAEDPGQIKDAEIGKHDVSFAARVTTKAMTCGAEGLNRIVVNGRAEKSQRGAMRMLSAFDDRFAETVRIRSFRGQPRHEGVADIRLARQRRQEMEVIAFMHTRHIPGDRQPPGRQVVDYQGGRHQGDAQSVEGRFQGEEHVLEPGEPRLGRQLASCFREPARPAQHAGLGFDELVSRDVLWRRDGISLDQLRCTDREQCGRQEWCRRYLSVGLGEAADDHVDLVHLQLAKRTDAGREPDVDVPESLLEARQTGDQPLHREGGWRVDHEHARCIDANHPVDRRCETVEGRRDVGEQALTFLGERERGAAIKQPDAERPLQRSDLAAHRPVRHAQRAGGA